MPAPVDIAHEIAQHFARSVPAAPDAARRLIALAGPPGAGKSTVAQALVDVLAHRGERAGLLAMDGFHLGNAILDDRGLRARKGAPETFDLAGFAALLDRLRIRHEVFVPVFDRDLDQAANAAAVVGADMQTVIVEGNYLLLDEPGWRDLLPRWDLTVYLHVDPATLETRLMARWLDQGETPDQARQKVQSNDLPNAVRVAQHRLPAALEITL